MKQKKTKKGSKKSSKKAKKKGKSKREFKILIIDSDSRNWDETFAKEKNITIDQAEWDQMIVQADSGSIRPLVNIKPNKNPRPETNRNVGRVIQPDFVIVRKLVRGLHVDREDYTNALYGFVFSGVPSVNTFMSIQQSLERPVVYARMKKIEKKLGHDKFPLIPMSYYSHAQALRFTPEFPLVAKIGYAEAGYAKLKFDKRSSVFNDFVGLLPLHSDYITLEQYIDNRECDLRIQKIGDHYRAYERVNPNWKGNQGTCVLKEVKMTEEYKLWAESVGEEFGMDILTVDAIRTKDGKNIILEINDTASGFAPDNQKEDMQHVKELALQRLREFYS